MGSPITHSLSPILHQQFAKKMGIALAYDAILLDELGFEQQVEAFFSAGGYGLNITAPGKLRAFNLAEIKTSRCLKAGAANMLWVDVHQRLCADNTDGVGFLMDLKQRVSLRGARILCLGAGGAARAILHVLLAEKPQSISIYNRTASRAQAWINTVQDHRVQYVSCPRHPETYDVVINTTGLIHPNHPAFLANQPFCYDLSYDESGLTPFVAWARHLGCEAVDGFGMLTQQAGEAFWVWHGVRPAL